MLPEQEYITNAKYSKALARSDEIEIDYQAAFLRQYANNSAASPGKKFLVSKANALQARLDDQN